MHTEEVKRWGHQLQAGQGPLLSLFHHTTLPLTRHTRPHIPQQSVWGETPSSRKPPGIAQRRTVSLPRAAHFNLDTGGLTILLTEHIPAPEGCVFTHSCGFARHICLSLLHIPLGVTSPRGQGLLWGSFPALPRTHRVGQQLGGSVRSRALEQGACSPGLRRGSWTASLVRAGRQGRTRGQGTPFQILMLQVM